MLVATQLMNMIFVPQFAVAGLALSISLGACLNAGLLFTGLRRRGIYTPKPGWLLFFCKLVVACALMGATAWYSAAQVDWTGMAHQTLLRIGALVAVIGVSALVYFGALMAMGFRFRDFKRTAR